MRERVDKLKEEVCTLFTPSKDMLRRMYLVDEIVHLGIDHLFEKEIETALKDIHESEFASSNLYEVALRFRLLRERGFWVSPDVFQKFKGDDGNFLNELADDPRGLLSLYNAAHLFIHGELELEETISFARNHLESMIRDSVVKGPLADQVKRALRLPLPRTLKRVEMLHYMFEYDQDNGHNPVLLELAKMDFNLLQQVHLKELKEISSAILDDTYDVYAFSSIDECRTLNAAIQGWDDTAISLVPEYLRKFYEIMLSTFREFEDQMPSNKRYLVAFNKAEAAEWPHRNYKPSFSEQVALATETTGVRSLAAGVMLGMSDAATTREAFEWAVTSTDAIISCAKIGRFMNDISGYKVTVDVAIAKINELMEDEWKTTNRARIDNQAVIPVTQRLINLTMAIPLFYGYDSDGFTFGEQLREILENLYVKPMPI
uniref:Terpene synthase N-terminal domain-containing protein n=1 Tax=Oryza nivara TaxID=4536 RepID=A0A0E0J444_ORYNI